MPISNGEPNCDNVQFDGSNNQLVISNLTAPIEIIRVRNSQWQEIFSCVANCDNPIVLPNLSEGIYRIQIQMYTENWSQICYRETETRVFAPSASNRNQITEVLPNFHLFPNPATDQVSLHVADYSDAPIQLSIVNQLGKIVYQKDNLLASDGIQSIDLQAFTNGLYFVQLSAKGRRLITKKLLVARLY